MCSVPIVSYRAVHRGTLRAVEIRVVGERPAKYDALAMRLARASSARVGRGHQASVTATEIRAFAPATAAKTVGEALVALHRRNFVPAIQHLLLLQPATHDA